jgi:hypothetical protein
MVATTVEAIVGAAFIDAEEHGEDGLDIVRRIMIRLGLYTHPLLLVTFRALPSFAFKNKQLITNMQFPSSLAQGPSMSSTMVTPRWLIW